MATKPTLSRRRRAVYAGVAVMAFFLVLEGGLRLTGVGGPPVVGSVRFGYRGGIPIHDEDGVEREGEIVDVPICEADPRLWWRPIADTPYTGKDGLRRPVPPSREKPAGTYRVAVVGDSCSFLGAQLYPTRFAELASVQRGGPVQVVNASSPGYSSHQGVRRLEEVWPWDPDVLVVYFGWNDHWRSVNGFTDADLAARPTAPPPPRFLAASRIYGLLAALLQSRATETSAPGPVRVPEGDYETNLAAIATAAADRDCPVVFITAPTAFVDGRLPVWAYAFFRQYYGMDRSQTADIPRTHERYNAIVRRVAAEHNRATLLDLAALWRSSPALSRFRRDCIHLSERGHTDAAQALSDVWRNEILKPES